MPAAAENHGTSGRAPSTGSEPKQARETSRGEGLTRLWFAALTFLPVVAVVVLLLRCGVNVPYLDQWDIVPQVEKAYSGNLTLADLWAPHNEHRIFFPQLIILGLARLTHWNIGYEMGVSLLLALGLLIILTGQIRATARGLLFKEWYQVLPAVSLVVFSTSQYQNWLWGFQLALFLNMLAATGGILLLSQPLFSWRRFAAAATLGVVATFSFATGVAFWPISLLLILLRTKARQRFQASLAWLALSALAVGSFFHHFNVAGSTSVATALTSPLECIRFLLKYVGGTLAQYSGGDASMAGKFALLFGIAAVGVMVWSVRELIRTQQADWVTLLPYLGLTGYSLGSGALAALGRVCLGSDQAASSRYCTMVVPLWTSLVVFLFLLLKSPPAMTKDSSAGNKPAPWCFGGVIVLLVLGSVMALDGASRLSARQTNGRNALLSLGRNPAAHFDYSELLALYPQMNVVVERYPVLKEKHLSLFKDEGLPKEPSEY